MLRVTLGWAPTFHATPHLLAFRHPPHISHPADTMAHIKLLLPLSAALMLLSSPFAHGLHMQKWWWDCVDQSMGLWDATPLSPKCGLSAIHHAREYNLSHVEWDSCSLQERDAAAKHFALTMLYTRLWCAEATWDMSRLHGEACPAVYLLYPASWPTAMEPHLPELLLVN